MAVANVLGPSFFLTLLVLPLQHSCFARTCLLFPTARDNPELDSIGVLWSFTDATHLFSKSTPAEIPRVNTAYRVTP